MESFNRAKRFNIMYMSMACLVFFLAVVFKIYELIAYTDLEYGVYNGPDLLRYVGWGLVLLFVLMSAVLVYFRMDFRDFSLIPKKSRILRYFSIFISFFSVVYSIFYVLELLHINANSEHNGNVMMHIIICVFVSILMPLSFIMISNRFAGRKVAFLDILLLVPSVWLCLRLLDIFQSDRIHLLSGEDSAFTVLRLSATCIFLFIFARFCLTLPMKKVVLKHMFFLGLLSCFAGLYSSVPLNFVAVTNFFDDLVSSNSADYYNYVLGFEYFIEYDFVLSIFIFVFILRHGLLRCCGARVNRVLTDSSSGA